MTDTGHTTVPILTVLNKDSPLARPPVTDPRAQPLAATGSRSAPLGISDRNDYTILL